MNLTFIGMSGSGKSFVGERYAKAYGMNFIDLGQLMKKEYQAPLKVILEDLGKEQYLKENERQVLKLERVTNTVISPGGSIVYSPKAMEFLKQHSIVVYLDEPIERILNRINPDDWGIVGLGNKTFVELYEERAKLYEKWADIVVKPEDVIVANLVSQIHQACMKKLNP